MNQNTIRQALTSDEIAVLESVYRVAKQCDYEAEHTNHVTNLALRIFDDLIELHQLSHQDRFFLLCASLLHDIGVHTDKSHAHHKNTLNVILRTPMLLFNQKERLIIGSIARYHRRALPSIKHDHYRALNPDDKNIVSILAGILRVADGLDYSHRQLINTVQTSYSKNKVKFLCSVGKSPVEKEINSAVKKSKLMELVFQRKITFKTQKEKTFSNKR